MAVLADQVWIERVARLIDRWPYDELRDELLSGVDDRLVRSLPVQPTAISQLQSDLEHLLRDAPLGMQQLLRNAARLTDEDDPTAARFQGALAQLDQVAPGAPPSAIIELDADPPPNYRELGFTQAPRRVLTSTTGWHTRATPGDATWQRAARAMRQDLACLSRCAGPVDIFATSGNALSVWLGLLASAGECRPRYWAPHGPKGVESWRRLGAAIDHGLQPLQLPTPDSVQAIQNGRPIALVVALNKPLPRRGLSLDPRLTCLSVQRWREDRRSINTLMAQQIASDLSTLWLSVFERAPHSTAHLIFDGPPAILMMAAPALRAARNVVIYDRIGTRYLPVMHFQHGKPNLVPPPRC